MMMKKTTSALAVAALLGTGAASAATFQVNDDTTIDVGGNFFIAYRSETTPGGIDETHFFDNGTDLIFSGEHAAGNGLTTFFNLDLDGFDSTQANSPVQDGLVDEASVGIRGNFGQILVGSNTSAYDMYADFADIENVGDRTSFSMGDQSDVIQYSNTLDNLDFMISLEVGDNQRADQAAEPTINDGSQTAIDAGASIDLGGLTLMGAYNDRAATDNGDAVYGIGASANLGGVDLTVGHEIDTAGNDQGIDKTVLTGSYSVGQWVLVGSVQGVSTDTNNTDTNVSAANQQDDSFTEVYAGATYNVTSQMSVYAEMMTADRVNDEDDYTAVGVNYSW